MIAETLPVSSLNSIGQRIPDSWCDDCGAELQMSGAGYWRCPWASSKAYATRQFVMSGMVAVVIDDSIPGWDTIKCGSMFRRDEAIVINYRRRSGFGA